VTHLHHGHSRAAVVEQLVLDALEDGERQRPRSSIEIECAVREALSGGGSLGSP